MKKIYQMSCAIDPELVAKLKKVTVAIRKNPEKGLYTNELTDRITELSSILMNYYFLESARILETKPMFMTMTKVGINTGLGIVRKISQTLIGNLDSKQLLNFVTHLESLIEEK